VEIGASDRRKTELDEKRKIENEIKERIPSPAFGIPLDDLEIPVRLSMLFAGEGYSTIGEVMMQLELDEDELLALNGVGPKAMETLKEAIENFEMPVEEVVVSETMEEEVEETDAEDSAEVSEEAVEEVQEAESEGEKKEEEESFVEALEMHEAEQDSKKEELFTEDSVVADPSGLFPDDKKKYREIEYDPDQDVTIVRKLRKGEGDEWDDKWTG
jgi:N utilization substance protein A